ncbi:hypothetical protein FVEG_17582 [Fusarium verticillioides 7600]|uniref:Zn(2)-C6 fungal-type domain-containing protein n=1 Tax=Gibberella moniliformis (strain M3125 / FGSC 7600) TaxID=334819 RepID=W7NGZ2_GIBM7|nr:hypothetical protein FVEG_17582 [Fusarium verticillioides 7600]EWG55717.1 hypothetical protein FVEG_17582 [Fusarium verticillioides 7600]
MRSEQACKARKKQKRRCDKALPECSLCKRTQRLCEYGIATDSQPTASDWSMMQARLTELENRLANSPRATEQHILSPPISGPLLEQGSTPGATFCDSIVTHSIESNSIISLSQSIDLTPAYSTVEYSGSALQTRFPASMFLPSRKELYQVFLITGASDGLGKELASILYHKNGKIYLAARSRSKADEGMRDIKAAHPKSIASMIFLPLVLDDLTTIKASAQGFLAQESRLDVLYNNAGVMVPPQGSKTVRSKDCRRSVISIVRHFISSSLLDSRN